jgi:mono/diheme cytochrome c family protein
MPFVDPRRTSHWAALTLALLPLSFGAAADDSKRPDTLDASQAARGQLIYQRFCAACHGPAGAGDGQLATGLRSRPTDLTRLAERNGGVFSFDKVSRAIDGRDTVRMHGPSDMPVWGEVFAKTKGTEAPDADEAVARITHYVWSIQKHKVGAQ